MEQWRFLNTGAADGVTNMAVDEALLLGVNRGISPPTVRVYAWKPPTVSTGYSQDLAEELDLEACRRLGYGAVRRPTGGRAILHAGELTYAVAGPSDRRPLAGSIMGTYRAIAGALLSGLEVLGVRAALAPVAGEERRVREGPAPPCFASSARFEVVYRGAKLIGSAQRRVGRGVLQHGSLLIDGTHTGLADVLWLRSDRAREAVRRTLEEKTTNLEAILGRPVFFEEVADAIRAGFRESWGEELRKGPLTQDEENLIEEVTTRGVVAA